MVQTVQDENGLMHEFPDDATPEEMNASFASVDKENRLNKTRDILSNNALSYADQGAKEFSGGLLNSLVGMAKAGLNMTAIPKAVKSAQSLLPDKIRNKLESAENFDPYKAMGTEEKRFYTPGGAIQLAGELFSPGEGLSRALPGIKKTLPEILDRVNPGRIARRLEDQSAGLLGQAENHEQEIPSLTKSLSEHLGQGAKTTEEISPQIANEVRNLHDAREANAGIYFNHVLNQVKNTPDKGLLYKKADPLISTALDEGKDLMGQIKDLKVGDLYKKFEEVPTFENAHNLQQELGLMIGDLKKIPGKSADQRIQLSSIKSARDKLKSDMTNYLEDKYPNKNENLAPMWQKGTDLYREEVAPLLSNKKLREINRGRKNYVKNIHAAFENPEAADEILRTGEKIKGSGSKVLDMLPESTKNKILFSKIGAHSGEDANRFLSSIDTANRKGYSKYISPTLQKGLEEVMGKKNMIESLKNESASLHPKISDLLKKQKFYTSIAKKSGIGGLASIVGEELIRRNM